MPHITHLNICLQDFNIRFGHQGQSRWPVAAVPGQEGSRWALLHVASPPLMLKSVIVGSLSGSSVTLRCLGLREPWQYMLTAIDDQAGSGCCECMQPGGLSNILLRVLHACRQ